MVLMRPEKHQFRPYIEVVRRILPGTFPDATNKMNTSNVFDGVASVYSGAKEQSLNADFLEDGLTGAASGLNATTQLK